MQLRLPGPHRLQDYGLYLNPANAVSLIKACEKGTFGCHLRVLAMQGFWDPTRITSCTWFRLCPGPMSACHFQSSAHVECWQNPSASLGYSLPCTTPALWHGHMICTCLSLTLHLSETRVARVHLSSSKSLQQRCRSRSAHQQPQKPQLEAAGQGAGPSARAARQCSSQAPEQRQGL